METNTRLRLVVKWSFRLPVIDNLGDKDFDDKDCDEEQCGFTTTFPSTNVGDVDKVFSFQCPISAARDPGG